MINLTSIEIDKNIAALEVLRSGGFGEIDEVVDVILNAINKSNKILFLGVGGNAMICENISQDIKGHYRPESKSIIAFSLTSEIGFITRNLNDIGADSIFSAQLDSVGQAGDVLISLSSSGKSKSVVLAVNKANDIGMNTVSITGESGGHLRGISDIRIMLPSSNSSIIENLSLVTGHIIAKLVSSKLT